MSSFAGGVFAPSIIRQDVVFRSLGGGAARGTRCKFHRGRDYLLRSISKAFGRAAVPGCTVNGNLLRSCHSTAEDGSRACPKVDVYMIVSGKYMYQFFNPNFSPSSVCLPAHRPR